MRKLWLALILTLFAGAAAAAVVPPYPPGSLLVTSSSGNVAAATATATLPAVVGRTTYLTSWQCGGGGATGASNVLITITGLIGGTMTVVETVPAGANLLSPIQAMVFDWPLAASAENTAIVVSMPSLGAGNLNAYCTAAGFQS